MPVLPYKDSETDRIYKRERLRRLKENPEYKAREAAKAAAYYQKKKKEDAAWELKRQEDTKKWYALHGKENARDRKGYQPLEEYLQSLTEQRKKKAAYMAEWHKTEIGQRSRVTKSIKKRCGLSIDEYDKVYDRQGGRCLICTNEKPRYGRGRLVVDHCHTKGTFRALLCANCNSAIGLLGENKNTIQNAISYLDMFLDKDEGK